MKLIVIFGIVLPVAIIVVLAILGSTTIGFSVDTDFEEEISLGEFSSSGQLDSKIRLGVIEIQNDYFLGKRYDLKPLGACLMDSQDQKSPLSAGTVTYSEGDLAPEEVSIYNYRNQERSVEVGAYATKQVMIYLESNYQFRYKNFANLTSQYGDYDTIIVFEMPKTNSRSVLYYPYSGNCDVSQEVIDNAEKIRLRV